MGVSLVVAVVKLLAIQTRTLQLQVVEAVALFVSFGALIERSPVRTFQAQLPNFFSFD
jgi:hypothetical protein